LKFCFFSLHIHVVSLHFSHDYEKENQKRIRLETLGTVEFQAADRNLGHPSGGYRGRIYFCSMSLIGMVLAISTDNEK